MNDSLIQTKQVSNDLAYHCADTLDANIHDSELVTILFAAVSTGPIIYFDG